jgi:hypothetical protein
MKPTTTILLLVIAIVFASCNNEYGQKIKTSDHTEVYIKGDSVTEADAKKFGTFLDTTYKDSKNKRSFQITKDSGQYVIRMVVDEEKVKKDSSLDVSFMALQILFETQVFTGNKVKLILTDNQFKDIKIFPSSNSPDQ